MDRNSKDFVLLAELSAGPVMVSDWCKGRGKRIRKKPIPEGATTVWRDGTGNGLLTRRTLKYVQRLFASTYTTRVVALTRKGEAILRRDRGVEYEIRLNRVRAFDMVLEDVPNHMRTREMCEAAMGNTYIAQSLIHVPEHLRTRRMCLLAVEAGNSVHIGDVPCAHQKAVVACKKLVGLQKCLRVNGIGQS